MTLDERGRRAAAGIRRAVDAETAADAGPDPMERFDRSLRAQRRNQRISSGVGGDRRGRASTLVLSSCARSGRPGPAHRPRQPLPLGHDPVRGMGSSGTSLAHWYTIANGRLERLTDLGIDASCAVMVPRRGAGSSSRTTPSSPRKEPPLRPAMTDPDGSNLRPLDAVEDPGLRPGLRRRVAGRRRGSRSRASTTRTPERDRDLHGARDTYGGGLVRLTSGLDGPPTVLARRVSVVVFMRTRPGIQPDGAGALFVVDADGRFVPIDITPWGASFLDNVVVSLDGE